MKFLQTIWPTPFSIKKGNVLSFVIQLLIFVIVCALLGWLIAKLAGLALIGKIFALLGSVMEIYGLVGIVLCVLKFIGVV